MTTIEAPTLSSEAMVERLFNASVAAFDLYGVYIGERLGLYRVLSEAGPLDAAGLSSAAGIDERYAREWLEQQAAFGVLVFRSGRFSLPESHAAVLATRDDPNYFAPIARMLVSAAQQLPRVVAAFGTGDGVGWDEYGLDMIEGQSELNRPFFFHQLTPQILPAIPEVHGRLSRAGARVAEVGFGGGWASIAIAQAYPGVTVEGFDPDAVSVEIAEANAREAGLAGRVRFHGIDGARAADDGHVFDVVCAFECIHDMANPVDVLAAMRRLAGDGGVVLVMDEAVPDRFDPTASDDVERFFYGFSVTTCLPNGRAEHPSAATGTVMRAPTLEQYARQAGFGRVRALPVEAGFFRLYLLE